MEHIFPKNQLMVMLNEVRRRRTRPFSVVEPFTGTEMLEVKALDGRFNVKLAGKNDFGPYPSKDDYWSVKDIPDFYDYKDCLISSGLVDFSNWDEFKDWIEYLYKSEIDATLSSKSVFLSIDSNMAYHRLISRRFPLEVNGTRIEPEAFEYLLSTIVEQEIDHHIRNKYDRSDLKLMGMYTDIGELRRGFKNRGTLETRKAKFATQELNYLRGELNAARVSGTPSKTDSEKNDIRIVESLEHFCRDKNIVPAFISSDRNMGNHAENHEIPYFVLELPHSIPRENDVSPDVMTNLLHDLALTFGAIKIPGLKTTMHGLWGVRPIRTTGMKV